MTIQLTLFVPGLLQAVDHLDRDVPRLDSLETLFSRANQREMGCSGYYPCVEKLFGHQGGMSLAPNAAIARLGEGGKADEHIWMHVDPVYMQADKDRLLLRGNELLDLTDAEVSTVLNELNELYREDDYHFESYHPQRWYLGLPDDPDCDFSPLSDVLGRNVEPFLPTGKEQTHWRRFMNEVQMHLHASTINQQRLEEQSYPVNSLWCWGSGVISDMPARWNMVYSNDPLLSGLAKLSNSGSAGVPANADELLQQRPTVNPAPNADILVAFSETEHHILNKQRDFWLQYLMDLEKQWIMPLLKSVKNRQVVRLDVVTTNGKRFTLNRKNLGKWWRRSQPWIQHLGN